MFDAVLIANRGEIAVRIIRACRELGVRSVAVHSDLDAGALHVRCADEAHLLGPTPAAQSYLDAGRVLEVASWVGVDAVHPGYGFLSESADFARAVIDAGFTWVGPPPSAMERMGDKVAARAVARAAHVAVVPGTTEPTTDPEVVRRFGETHGYPLAIKAAHGGGGRGMKVVDSTAAVADALVGARREAEAAFGRGECYVERYLERPRHVEVQVLADLDGTTVHLGDRDCSLQRRHQKLVEEAPAPRLAERTRTALHRAAVQVAEEVGYVGAGTCEFLVDVGGDARGDPGWYFLEMNTRLQVEHPVTELVTGIDLVQAQLRIAAGEGMRLSQDDVVVRGHAIEVRLNAEDPAAGFAPAPGVLTRLRVPDGPWVRFDGGVEASDEIPGAYDSMIGKLVVWGQDREEARHRMRRALDELVVEGVPTTLPFHRLALAHEQFAAGTHSTISVEHEWDLSSLPSSGSAVTEPAAPVSVEGGRAPTAREVELTVSGRPLRITVHGVADTGTAARQASAPREGAHGTAARGAHDGPQLRAPMQGTVVSYAVSEGDQVSTDDLVCVIEAMKMENHVVAHRDGTVEWIALDAGAPVEQGAVLATIAES